MNTCWGLKEDTHTHTHNTQHRDRERERERDTNTQWERHTHTHFFKVAKWEQRNSPVSLCCVRLFAPVKQERLCPRCQTQSGGGGRVPGRTGFLPTSPSSLLFFLNSRELRRHQRHGLVPLSRSASSESPGGNAELARGTDARLGSNFRTFPPVCDSSALWLRTAPRVSGKCYRSSSLLPSSPHTPPLLSASGSCI